MTLEHPRRSERSHGESQRSDTPTGATEQDWASKFVQSYQQHAFNYHGRDGRMHTTKGYTSGDVHAAALKAETQMQKDLEHGISSGYGQTGYSNAQLTKDIEGLEKHAKHGGTRGRFAQRVLREAESLLADKELQKYGFSSGDKVLGTENGLLKVKHATGKVSELDGNGAVKYDAVQRVRSSDPNLKAESAVTSDGKRVVFETGVNAHGEPVKNQKSPDNDGTVSSDGAQINNVVSDESVQDPKSGRWLHTITTSDNPEKKIKYSTDKDGGDVKPQMKPEDLPMDSIAKGMDPARDKPSFFDGQYEDPSGKYRRQDNLDADGNLVSRKYEFSELPGGTRSFAHPTVNGHVLRDVMTMDIRPILGGAKISYRTPHETYEAEVDRTGKVIYLNLKRERDGTP